MKCIDIEDDYSIYWWVIRHFRIMDFQSNKEIFNSSRAEIPYFSEGMDIPSLLT